MSTQWIAASGIFDGQSVLHDHALQIDDGLVTAVANRHAIPADAMVRQINGTLLTGFFDIQVNGGGGALLNTQPTVEGIETILKAHRGLGTTAILPTVITDRPEVTEAAVMACLEAKHLRGMRGIHIEGPHLSVARRGTHQAALIRDMDALTMGLVRKARDADVPVLITVASETTTPAQVAELVGMGAVVSVGHSDASADDANALVQAGATCFTHLFNAMSPMLNRSPGVTGAAIASDVWCSIIADGIHVDPLMVALAFRARPVTDRMIAVSDAMATVGGPDHFRLYGQDIHLHDGRLINDEGSLAGAHLTMVDAVRNLVSYGIPLEDALRMGTSNPAALMGLSREMALVGSSEEELIVLGEDLRLKAVGLAGA